MLNPLISVFVSEPFLSEACRRVSFSAETRQPLNRLVRNHTRPGTWVSPMCRLVRDLSRTFRVLIVDYILFSCTCGEHLIPSRGFLRGALRRRRRAEVVGAAVERPTWRTLSLALVASTTPRPPPSPPACRRRIETMRGGPKINEI